MQSVDILDEVLGSQLDGVVVLVAVDDLLLVFVRAQARNATPKPPQHEHHRDHQAHDHRAHRTHDDANLA